MAWEPGQTSWEAFLVLVYHADGSFVVDLNTGFAQGLSTWVGEQEMVVDEESLKVQVITGIHEVVPDVEWSQARSQE